MGRAPDCRLFVQRAAASEFVPMMRWVWEVAFMAMSIGGVSVWFCMLPTFHHVVIK